VAVKVVLRKVVLLGVVVLEVVLRVVAVLKVALRKVDLLGVVVLEVVLRVVAVLKVALRKVDLLGVVLLASFCCLILPYYLLLGFVTVLAALRNALAVGAPLVPGLRIFSPLPALIRRRLAWMFAYRPIASLILDASFMVRG
jgi:hypothetical protein